MKKLLNKYPNCSRYALAIILFVLAIVIGGIMDTPFLKLYFPYISCLLLFVVTWFLLKIDHKSLKYLGLNGTLKNISFLPLGIGIGIIALFGAKFIRALYTGETFELSTAIDYSTILIAFYYILPQVAVEELLFRGYLFKKTIEISNVVTANIIFSILFMLIHVLDEQVLKSKGMIIMLMVTIPVGHLLFATALIKSKSLFFPIGIHLGNNWATRHLISDANNGDSILFIPEVTTFETWAPFIIFIILFNGFFLLMTLIIWKWDYISVFIRHKVLKQT